jgi:metal-responsive CopG/Arc/MetJ family transcriptional regulator
MKEAIKVTTLRLTRSQAAELDAVARVQGVLVSEALREAIRRYIAESRAEPQFKERLQRLLEEDHEVFERLAVEPERGA